MLDKLKKLWYNAHIKWNRFLSDHGDINTSLELLKYILISVLILAIVCTLCAVTSWALTEPTCAKMAESYTGNYQNGVFTGCFVQLPDGEYYYHKNIIVNSVLMK
jgi:hypothetical protein